MTERGSDDADEGSERFSFWERDRERERVCERDEECKQSHPFFFDLKFVMTRFEFTKSSSSLELGFSRL